MPCMDDWCAIQLPEPGAHTWSVDWVQHQVSMSTPGWHFRFTFQDPDLATLFVLSWCHLIVQVTDDQIPS